MYVKPAVVEIGFVPPLLCAVQPLFVSKPEKSKFSSNSNEAAGAEPVANEVDGTAPSVL